MGRAAGGGQAVVHPQTFLPSNDQPSFAKVDQMPRHGGLRAVQYGDNMANADLAAPEQIENPQPGSVGDGPKNLRDLR
jgi:hypothetical protein